MLEDKKWDFPLFLRSKYARMFIILILVQELKCSTNETKCWNLKYDFASTKEKMDISQHLIFEKKKKRILKVWYLVVSIFYFKMYGLGLSMSPYIQIAKHMHQIFIFMKMNTCMGNYTIFCCYISLQNVWLLGSRIHNQNSYRQIISEGRKKTLIIK